MVLHQYTKEFRHTLTLASPVMLGMLGHTFVGLVDNIMVGQLGTAELAAVSLGNSFMFITMSLGIGFSTAITPLVAEADAENNVSTGISVCKHGLFLCAALGTILFLGILAAKPLMYMMGQPVEVVALAMPYLNLVAISLIPLIIFQALKQFSDGLSMTKPPMYATLIANGINIILNYLLIFGKLGFPQLGIVGAAIGTLVSRILMVVFLWILLVNKEKTNAYLYKIKLFTLENSMLKKILSLGLPSALQMFFEVAIFTAAIWLSGVLGKNHQAANQIALNLASMTFMVAMGLSVAAMIRVSNQRGVKRYIELRRIALSILLLAFLLALIFALIFTVFHQLLPTIYLDQNDAKNLLDTTEVIHIAAKLLIIAAWFQISDGIQVVMLGALRGIQDVKVPLGITFIAYWVVGFPISYYLCLHTAYQSSGIWMGLLVGLTVSAILLYMRFDYLSKNLIRKSSNRYEK